MRRGAGAFFWRFQPYAVASGPFGRVQRGVRPLKKLTRCARAGHGRGDADTCGDAPFGTPAADVDAEHHFTEAFGSLPGFFGACIRKHDQELLAAEPSEERG